MVICIENEEKNGWKDAHVKKNVYLCALNVRTIVADSVIPATFLARNVRTKAYIKRKTTMMENVTAYAVPLAAQEASNTVQVPLWLVIVLLLCVGVAVGWVVRAMRQREKRHLQELKDKLEKKHSTDMDALAQRVLAGVSRELMTPATLIIGPLQQLAAEPMGAEMSRRLQVILRHAQMLLHQVNMLPLGLPTKPVEPLAEDMLQPLPKDELTAAPVAAPVAAPLTDAPAHELTGIADHNAAHEADGLTDDDRDPSLPASHRFTMLMVDDSSDMRRFVRDYFRGEYNVITAANGEEALKCLDEIDNIDLVVSDVAMPKMDGLALCKKVKNDLRWSHIPVILLTGYTDEEMEVEGLKMGADDYITKPFNAEMLRLRVKKLVEIKAKRQREFEENVDVSPREITITPMDEQFIQRAMKICEEHISDVDFSVEVLGQELSMSRTYLYKKLINITGKGPAEFIRTIRLKRGRMLLENSNKQIAEISVELGYANPKRFTENFKAEFGMSPSEWLRKFRMEQAEKALRQSMVVQEQSAQA